MTNLLLVLCLLQDPLEAGIDRLLPALAAESLEERTTAAAELKELARSDARNSRPLLLQRLKRADDEQIKAGLRAAIDALPRLELRLALKEPLTVGGSPSVQAWIRNLSESEVCLPRFQPAKAWIFPPSSIRFTVTQGDRGVTFGEPLFRECGLARIAAPEAGDLVPLAPGKEMDFLAEVDGSPASLRSWKQTEAGTLAVEMVLDFRTPARDHAGITLEMRKLVDRIPREELTARISTKVEEPK